ncbi:MAG: HEPN domain-containing protein [Promethearchaeota archaeon]
MTEWPADSKAWFDEAIWDLEAANDLLKTKKYNYACFHAQQSAEKALKALLRSFNENSWGHSVRYLLERYEKKTGSNTGLETYAKELDRHYIPSRYPDALPYGSPKDAYDEVIATKCLHHAEEILDFVEKQRRRMQKKKETHKLEER